MPRPEAPGRDQYEQRPCSGAGAALSRTDTAQMPGEPRRTSAGRPRLRHAKGRNRRPSKLRHSVVLLMSDRAITAEESFHLVGHRSTRRSQIVSVYYHHNSPDIISFTDYLRAFGPPTGGLGCMHIVLLCAGSESSYAARAASDSAMSRMPRRALPQRERCCHLLPCVACGGGVLSTALVIRWSAAAVRRSAGSPILFPSVSHQPCWAASMA